MQIDLYRFSKRSTDGLATLLRMASSDDLSSAIAGHYARLAGRYDVLWDHTPAFRKWMVSQIIEVAQLTNPATVGDIGGGTGIFAVELLRQLDGRATVYLVDPSAEMLAQSPVEAHLHRVCASAENTRDALSRRGVEALDFLLIKEAVHHFSERPATLRDLSRLVKPGGSLLVVMLPKHIEYPLFDAALERFAEMQPDPADIQSYLASAGMTTTRELRGFRAELPKERWLKMVANRFMSLLSDFNDDELARGVREIEMKLADVETVRFSDNFEFVRGQYS